MGDISVKVVFDKTFNLRKAFGIAPRRLIKKLCFDTEAEAKRNAPVDTGALRASIYSSVPGGGDYENAKSQAEARAAKKRQITMLPEEKPNGILEGVVSVGVEYAVNVELGTVKQPARPYLLPAAEKVSTEAVKAAEQLWGEEIGKI